MGRQPLPPPAAASAATPRHTDNVLIKLFRGRRWIGSHHSDVDCDSAQGGKEGPVDVVESDFQRMSVDPRRIVSSELEILKKEGACAIVPSMSGASPHPRWPLDFISA